MARTIRTRDEIPGLDVGANAGLFTHLIWTLKPDAKIVAFEPLPRMVAKIKDWQARSGARLTIHNQAVADRCGTASFYALADNDIGASLTATDRAGGEPLSVLLVTLDSAMAGRSPFLIKIDVEGAEPEVLAGAQPTLTRAKFLIIEAHTEEALGKIREQLGSRWQRRRVGASDYLFWQGSPG